MKWYVTAWIVSWIILAVCGILMYSPPYSTDTDILGSTGVQQDRLDVQKEFTREIDGYKITITAKYRYILTGMVVGKDEYRHSTMDKLSPMDLTIAWGKTIDPQYHRYITFNKYTRNCKYNYYFPRGEKSLSNQYISEHASNNHLIFADVAAYNTAKDVRIGSVVTVEGYLVDVYGRRSDGAYIAWHTSTKRSDIGGNSCEVLYAEKITAHIT